jgi:hypothetical protein
MLPRLSSPAKPEEQKMLLLTMLDAVYIDTKHILIIATISKPSFKPVF